VLNDILQRDEDYLKLIDKINVLIIF